MQIRTLPLIALLWFGVGCGEPALVLDPIDSGADTASDAGVADADAGRRDASTGDAAPDAALDAGGCVAGCEGNRLVECSGGRTEEDCSRRANGFCNPDTLACEAVQGDLRAWVATVDPAGVRAGSPFWLDVVVQSRLLASSRAEPIVVSDPSVDAPGWTADDTSAEPVVNVVFGERATRRIVVTPPSDAAPDTAAELQINFLVGRDLTITYRVVQDLVVGRGPEVPFVIGDDETRPRLEVRRSEGPSYELGLTAVRLDATGAETETFDMEYVVRAVGGGAVTDWVPSALTTVENTLTTDLAAVPVAFVRPDLSGVPSTTNVEVELHLSFLQTSVGGTPVTGRRTDLVVPIRVLPDRP